MNVDDASHLWVEAGNMSGGSRNQIEFSDELVRFFDEASRHAGQVFIAYDSTVKGYCPLADRGQGYGQWTDIWRLGLITQDKGGESYPGRIIHFEKKTMGKRYAYIIDVVDPLSAKHKEYIKKSVVTGVTGGAEGRNFGYW